jgi:anti-sigma factor RsiW
MISRYLEGELDQSACATLEQHVSACPACAEACETLRGALLTCRKWRTEPLPAELRDSVRLAIAATAPALRGR